MLVKLLHPLNASLPILVTLSGIVVLASTLQSNIMTIDFSANAAITLARTYAAPK